MLGLHIYAKQFSFTPHENAIFKCNDINLESANALNNLINLIY